MDSVLKDVLMEEYTRKIQNRSIYIKKMEKFPRGSLTKKKRNSGFVYYFSYRHGDRVVTNYVKKDELESTKQAIEMRKQVAAECKNLSKQIKDLEIEFLAQMKGGSYTISDVPALELKKVEALNHVHMLLIDVVA